MKDEEKILDKEGTDIVEKQLMSPVSDTEEGNIYLPDKAKEIGEETDVDTIVQLLNKDAKESFSPKYQKELANKAKEDPNSVMIETPKGWMTVAKAMKDGFNPESGEFDGETVEQRVDRIIKEEGLDPDEASRIKQMVLQKEEESEPAPEAPLGKEDETDEEKFKKYNKDEEYNKNMESKPTEPIEGAAPTDGAEPVKGQTIDPALLAALGGGK